MDLMPIRTGEFALTSNPSSELVEFSSARCLVHKIPEHVYQDFFTLAQYHEVEYAKRMIFGKLKEYLTQKFPDLTLINFGDFNKREASILSQHTGHPVEWGMYVLLAPVRGDSKLVTAHELEIGQLQLLFQNT